MPLVPLYRPLFDELLAFVAQPPYAAELVPGRLEYLRQTGEVFTEDRSFDLRMQGFLDWFVFDRPLASNGDPPVRIYPTAAGLDEARSTEFRLLGRTVHGLFEVVSQRSQGLTLLNLLTEARYRVPLPGRVEGFDHADFFEGRLVPYQGSYHLSPAFIFHPRDIRSLVLYELERQRHERSLQSVQEVIFTLSRMATKAEHYRNVKIEAIYDFARPPPAVEPASLRFDRASVEKRLGRLPPETQRVA
jgi:hypothetical protein